MPNPHSIAQHLSPLGGGPQPNQGFLNPQPTQEPAPQWQQPGLGQTLLGGAQPSFPQSPTTGLGGLPPRRSPGQAPLSGALNQPAATWGSQPQGFPPAEPLPGQFPQRSQGAPGHSSLIPGSPTLPVLGNPSQDQVPQSSLLGRDLPSAPPSPTPQSTSPGLTLPAPQAPRMDMRTRPLKKPSRTSNIFMFSLALLFLAGFLGAAGWMFREPIMEVVNRFMPPKEKASTVEIPSANVASASTSLAENPTPTATLPTPPVPSDTAMAEAPVTPAFDPNEPVPQKAQLPSADELAALKQGSMPNTQSLLEVPSKPLAPGLQQTTPETAPMVPPTGENEIKMQVTEEAKPAAEALLKFLNAADLKERLRYTLAADAMKPLMERYYEAQPSGPVKVDAIALVRLDPKPQMGGGAHAVFGVESRGWEFPVPVMLEESKDGFRVDWLSFVEFKDRLLENFFQEYQEGSARFHVGITRTHYFEDKVPNAGNKDAFRLGPAPPNPYLTTVFLDKDSAVGRDLRDRIPWGAQVWAIVELEWVKLGSQQWVQIVGVPQLNWYSVPNEPKITPGRNRSEVPTETQRAVPIGR